MTAFFAHHRGVLHVPKCLSINAVYVGSTQGFESHPVCVVERGSQAHRKGRELLASRQQTAGNCKQLTFINLTNQTYLTLTCSSICMAFKMLL